MIETSNKFLIACFPSEAIHPCALHSVQLLSFWFVYSLLELHNQSQVHDRKLQYSFRFLVNPDYTPKLTDPVQSGYEAVNVFLHRTRAKQCVYQNNNNFYYAISNFISIRPLFDNVYGKKSY